MRLLNEFETESVRFIEIESSVSLFSGVRPLKIVSDDFKNSNDSINFNLEK